MADSNKLPLVKSGMKLLVDQLGPQDRVSIVVYAGAAGLALPPTSGARKDDIHAALERLAGPEDDVLVDIDPDEWHDDVEAMQASIDAGWEPPPLLAEWQDGRLLLQDGNHRYEALVRAGEPDAVIADDGHEQAPAVRTAIGVRVPMVDATQLVDVSGRRCHEVAVPLGKDVGRRIVVVGASVRRVASQRKGVATRRMPRGRAGRLGSRRLGRWLPARAREWARAAGPLRLRLVSARPLRGGLLGRNRRRRRGTHHRPTPGGATRA